MKRDMEKEKTRGRTRRKQPSQVAGFLYREGRKWCAAALSLCMILNNMASVTWAAESVAEKEVLFKLTSRSLYEALQEAVREETMVDDHFLFEGKEKDVEAYEKLLLLDDDLYELKPEFENKDEVTNAEKKNDLQLRIFASLGWETDPEREYQVVGDEKIIFCLSNASETEQTAVIQVDEKTTEEIVLVPGSAVVIDSKSEEESLEAESGDERKEDEEQEETESGESEGQAEEENNSEGVKGVGGNSGAGGVAGGNGGNSGNGSNGGNSGNSESGENSSEFSDSNNSGEASEKENFVESGSSAGGEDSAESEGSVGNEDSVKSEGFAENESSVGNKNSAENEDKADEPAADAEENRNDETQEKADAEGQDKESKDSQETVNMPNNGNSQENTKEPGNANAQENANTQDKAEEKDERKDEEVKHSSTSEKEETEKLEKTEAGSSESGKSDKADAGSNESGKSESGNNESEKTGKEESGNTDSGKADKADKPDKTDKSDHKESSKPETSEKSESGNTSAGKGEKSDTEKSGSDRSGNSDSSKKSESSKNSSDSGSSDNSSDKGKEVSAGISRNVIRLVADNLEVSASDDMEETESAEETTILDIQEEQKEEVIEDESEEIKAETEEVKTETEEAKAEIKEVMTKTEEVKAENASPSNVEDDEIEGELYAPVVMNEESIIVFVTTAEELGLNRAELRKASDSNAKRISPAYEGEVELENVIVQVKADENVLPEGVKLQVKELKQEGEDVAQYEEAKEALDSQGTEYDGMMALDISFLDKKGREIEPDGNVQVSIKVKKEALPEEADLESIAVQHLAEEEGEIFVEEVADCGDKTRGKVEVEAEEHVEAAFEVGSFSVFTIIWSEPGRELDKAAKLVVNFYNDDDKRLIDGAIIKVNQEMFLPGEDQTIDLAKYFTNAVDGYSKFCSAAFSTKSYIFTSNGQPEYERNENGEIIFDQDYTPTRKMDDKTGSVTKIKVEALNYSGWDALKYKITMYDDTEVSGELWGGSGTYNKDNKEEIILGTEKLLGALEIRLDVYCKSISTDFALVNQIIQDGCLYVKRPLESNQHYVWYKWEKSLGHQPNESLKTKVVRSQVTGNKYNMAVNGEWVNVALDKGSQMYYQVKIYADGADEDKDSPVMSSTAFLVNYYNKLENGDFENPVVPETQYKYLPNDTDELIWKSTTGTVELVKRGSAPHHLDIEDQAFNNGYMSKAQCAELNSDHSGSLYQDVLTMPGSTLHWSLLHRARGPVDIDMGETYYDTMYVLIMPTKLAEELFGGIGVDNQNALIDVVDQIKADSRRFPGASLTELKDANRGWYRHGGDYSVGDTQCLTRFFFIAGDVASKMPTYGNLIDDVWFGTALPPVIQQLGNLSITKIVQGLSDDDMPGYSLQLKITSLSIDSSASLPSSFQDNGDGTYSSVISLNAFDGENKNYSKTGGLSNLPLGKYEIEEIFPTDFGDPTSISMKQVTRIPNEVRTPLSNTKNCRVQLDGGQTTEVEITNVYPAEQKGTFYIKKSLKDGKKFTGANVGDVHFQLYKVTEGVDDSEQREAYGEPVGVKKQMESPEADDNLYGLFEFSNLSVGTYYLKETVTTTGYVCSEDEIKILIKAEQNGSIKCYYFDESGKEVEFPGEGNPYTVTNEPVSGAILPDTGGPGLAMFERYGWFLLMLALLMAGVEVRCYGERKYRRASVGQHEEFEDPL